MRKMKIYVYIVIIAVSIYYTFQSLSFGLWKGFGPGPGLFPLILGIAMLILSGIQLFSEDALKSKEKDTFLTRDEAIRVLFLTLLTLLVIVFMNTVGFLFSMILYSFVVFRYLEAYTTGKSICISIMVPFILWLIFYVAFKIDLPKGILSIVLLL